METFKKVFAVVMVITIIVIFASCSSNNEQITEETEVTVEEEKEAEVAMPAIIGILIDTSVSADIRSILLDEAEKIRSEEECPQTAVITWEFSDLLTALHQISRTDIVYILTEDKSFSVEELADLKLVHQDIQFVCPTRTGDLSSTLKSVPDMFPGSSCSIYYIDEVVYENIFDDYIMAYGNCWYY